MKRHDRREPEIIPATEEEIEQSSQRLHNLFAPHMQDALMKTLYDSCIVIAQEGLLHD